MTKNKDKGMKDIADSDAPKPLIDSKNSCVLIYTWLISLLYNIIYFIYFIFKFK